MKIAFCALSGIRACDPELLELGLTLPGFVERSKQIAALPSLGLLSLAACTPEGHELTYYEASGDGEEPAELYGYELVALSTFSAQVKEAYAIADRLRAAGVRVAMGGLHVSVLPEEALRHADYVVVGEGENVWPHVVALAESGAPGCILYADDYGPVRLDELPMPRYDLLGDRPYNRFTVQTSRGCPWRCEFCASSVMLRKAYRKRPVAAIVRDIEEILRLRPNAFIEFADDNTFVDARWGKELCRALEPLHIKWFTETDVSVADDEELLALMARAGCRQVLIGVEAPAVRGLAGLELRSDFKLRRHHDFLGAVQRIQAHGITVNGCFVLGLDGQGPEVFDQVAELVLSSGLYEVQVTLQTPFPGTPLHARLEREGRLTHPGEWERCTLFDLNYVPDGMSEDALRAGLHDLTRRLYTSEAVTERRERFFRRLRKGRSRTCA